MKLQFLFQPLGHAERSAYNEIYHRHVETIVENLPKDWEIIFNPEPQDGFLTVSLHVGIKGDIFMSHGLADKNWRNADVMGEFGDVCVSGRAMRHKLLFQGMDPKKLHTIGYPFLDKTFEAKAAGRFQELGNLIAWCPTHHHSPSTGPHLGPRIEPKLENNMFDEPWKFVSAIHPYHLASKKTTQELICQSSVVIGDTGSSVYEAWALGKPVVFAPFALKIGGEAVTNIVQRWKGSLEAQIYFNGVGRHADDLYGVEWLCHHAMENGITDEEVAFIDRVFQPELRGCSGEYAADIFVQIARRRGMYA